LGFGISFDPELLASVEEFTLRQENFPKTLSKTTTNQLVYAYGYPDAVLCTQYPSTGHSTQIYFAPTEVLHVMENVLSNTSYVEVVFEKGGCEKQDWQKFLIHW
jgi:hypothetical protein